MLTCHIPTFSSYLHYTMNITKICNQMALVHLVRITVIGQQLQVIFRCTEIPSWLRMASHLPRSSLSLSVTHLVKQFSFLSILHQYRIDRSDKISKLFLEPSETLYIYPKKNLQIQYSTESLLFLILSKN